MPFYTDFGLKHPKIVVSWNQFTADIKGPLYYFLIFQSIDYTKSIKHSSNTFWEGKVQVSNLVKEMMKLP
jgi:hypothetical protein